MESGKPGAVDGAKILVARIIANRDDGLVTTARAVTGDPGAGDRRLPNPVVPLHDALSGVADPSVTH
jgi:hypothetical protein